MHYYIDGYNLLFRINPKVHPLEQNRRQIILALDEKITDLNLDVTIVFDSGQIGEVESRRGHFGSTCVVYTHKKQTADEFILQQLQQSNNPSQETVVTSDRELARYCRALGSHTQNIDTFLAWLLKKKRKVKKQALGTSCVREIKETPIHFNRLLKIFEERLAEDLKKDKP